MVLVTIAQAARTVGVARSTIYSHLRSGKLSAIRTPTGDRRIDISELTRVYGPAGQTTQPDVGSPTPLDVALLQARIEALEAQNRLLRDEVQTGREEKAKLLDVISRGLLEAPKGKRRKDKKKGTSTIYRFKFMRLLRLLSMQLNAPENQSFCIRTITHKSPA